MRTDSLRVSDEARMSAENFIKETYGTEFYPTQPRVFKTRATAQDAHEAIRPITLDRRPEDLKDKIKKDEYRLYKLIYDRFLASQMADATYNSLVVDIECDKYKFKTTGKTLIFEGYTAL